MTDSRVDLAGIGAAIVQSLETGDGGATRHLRHERMTTWHNSDRIAVLEGTDGFEGLAAMHAMWRDVSATVASIRSTEDGFVAEIVLRATIRRNGAPIELHNCLVVTMADGKFLRVNEYVDPNYLCQFLAAPVASADSTAGSAA